MIDESASTDGRIIQSELNRNYTVNERRDKYSNPNKCKEFLLRRGDVLLKMIKKRELFSVLFLAIDGYIYFYTTNTMPIFYCWGKHGLILKIIICTLHHVHLVK